MHRNGRQRPDPLALRLDAYAGARVKGWPVDTFVRGRCGMWNGEILGPAAAEPIEFFPA